MSINLRKRFTKRSLSIDRTETESQYKKLIGMTFEEILLLDKDRSDAYNQKQAGMTFLINQAKSSLGIREHGSDYDASNVLQVRRVFSKDKNQSYSVYRRHEFSDSSVVDSKLPRIFNQDSQQTKPSSRTVKQALKQFKIASRYVIPQRDSTLTKVESKITKRDSNNDILEIYGSQDDQHAHQLSKQTHDARDQLSQDNSIISSKVLDAVGGFPEQRSLSVLDPMSPATLQRREETNFSKMIQPLCDLDLQLTLYAEQPKEIQIRKLLTKGAKNGVMQTETDPIPNGQIKATQFDSLMVQDLEQKFISTRLNKQIREPVDSQTTQVTEYFNSAVSVVQAQRLAVPRRTTATSLKASYKQIFSNLPASPNEFDTHKTTIPTPNGQIEYSYQYGSGFIRKISHEPKIRSPKILLEGKYVIQTTEQNITEDARDPTNFSDYIEKPFQTFETNETQRKSSGPAAKKNRVVMYAEKKKLNLNYRGTDPMNKVFLQRAIQRKQDQLDPKPHRFLNLETLSSFMSFRTKRSSRKGRRTQSQDTLIESSSEKMSDNHFKEIQGSPHPHRSVHRDFSQGIEKQQSSLTSERLPSKQREQELELTKHQQQLQILEQLTLKYSKVLEDTMEEHAIDVRQYLMSIQMFEDVMRRSFDPLSPSHDERLQQQVQIDRLMLAGKKSKLLKKLQAKFSHKSLQANNQEVKESSDDDNDDVLSRESEEEAKTSSAVIANLFQQTQSYQNRKRRNLTVEQAQIIEHYKLNERMGGIQYEGNMRKLKAELIKSFYRHLNIEKRKLMKLERPLQKSLKLYKAKIEERERLLNLETLKQDEVVAKEIQVFGKLKDTAEEILKEIEIEDAWDALRQFDPAVSTHTQEPMYKVPGGPNSLKTVAPMTQVLTSRFGLDLFEKLGPEALARKKIGQKTYPKAEESLPSNPFAGKPIGKASDICTMEIYEKERIASEFFKHLRDRHGTTHDTDINNSFSESCLRKNVIDVPVFARVSDNQLALSNYRLNKGLCESLGSYLKSSVIRLDQSFVLTALVLDNNGLTDLDFAALLEGLKDQRQLKSLVYTNNELGSQSLNQLQELIKNQEPQRLTELNISNVKMKPQETRQLVCSILPHLQVITVLKLASISLNDPSIVTSLCTLIDHHKSLQNLDFSNTKLFPAQIVEILECLKAKRNLRQLSLANNSMPSSSKSVPAFINCLSTLVTLRGGRINHLNLTCMALGGDTALQLAHAFGNSATLCAVHFSQNGIDSHGKQNILSVLNICQINALPVEAHDSVADALRQLSGHKQYESDKTIPVGAVIDSQLSKKAVLSSIKSTVQGLGQNHTVNDVFVLTRFKPYSELDFCQDPHRKGDDDMMLGFNSKWQIVLGELKQGQSIFGPSLDHDRCFICNNYRYVLLFFRRKDTSFFEPLTQQDIIKKLKTQCTKKETDLPVLMGGITQMSSSSMMPIRAFISKLRHRLPQNFKTQLADQIARGISTTLKTEMKQKSSIVPRPSIAINKISEKEEESVVSESESQSDVDHSSAAILSVTMVLNKLKQAEPEALILNYDASLDNQLKSKSQEEEECFAFASFVPPGKHCIVVHDQGKYFYKNIIIEARESQSLQPQTRKYKAKLRPEPFATIGDSIKLDETSVFRDWILDSPATFGQHFEQTVNWEPVFKVSHADQLSKVRSIFASHFTQIRSLFFELVSLQKYSQHLLCLKEFVGFLTRFKAQGTLEVAERPKQIKEPSSPIRGKKWFDKAENQQVNLLQAPVGIVYAEHIEAPFAAIALYLNDKPSQGQHALSQGEKPPIFGKSASPRVDLRGFLLTLIKIALLRNKEDVVSVIKTMIEVDIPELRSNISLASFVMNQQTGDLVEKPMTRSDQDFIIDTVFRDLNVNRILTAHSVSLMQAFSAIVDQATNCLLYDQLHLILQAMPLVAFRPAPAKPPKVSLGKITDAIISIETAQMCFFKSKMFASPININSTAAAFNAFSLKYEEFLVLLCRLTSSLFERVSPKQKGATYTYLNELKNQSFAAQLAVVINAVLPRLLLTNGRADKVKTLEEITSLIN